MSFGAAQYISTSAPENMGSTGDMITNPRCASYVRVSSGSQRDDGTIEMQIDYNMEAIKTLHGVEMGEFRDEAVSGYSRAAHERQQFARLVEAAQEGRVDVVVFFDESRLTRQILDFFEDVFSPIMRVNPHVKFYRSSDGVFWDPTSKEAQRNLIEAYQESEKKARLARQSQHYRFKTLKQRPGARLPFGIEAIQDNKLIPNEYFPIVLFIFELAARGYSERRIAEVLTNMQLIKGSTWQHTKIHYILNNPLYIGHLVVGRRLDKKNGSLKALEELTDSEILRNKFTPLVPIDLWELVHTHMRYKSDDKSIRTGRSFLLTGVLRCTPCGELMRTQNSLKPNSKGVVHTRTKKGSLLRYYWCPGCQRRVDPDQIEDVVVSQLSRELSLFFTADGIRRAAARFKRHLNSRVAGFDGEIQVRRLQLNQLESGYFSNSWDDETSGMLKSLARERIDELQKAKEIALDLRNSIDSLCSQEGIIHRLVGQARAISNVLPQHELRSLVMQLVERVDVSVNRAGTPSIDCIEYRTLPLPYVTNELKQIDLV